MFHLTEEMKIVQALEPATDAAGRTADYVSLKNINMAWIVLHITQGNAATIAITVEKATAVAPTGSTAITEVVPIWVNADLAASDTLVKQTSAVAFTTDAGVKHKQVIFQIDPALLGPTFDVITVKTGASDIANITSAQYYLVTAYKQATPPTALTD